MKSNLGVGRNSRNSRGVIANRIISENRKREKEIADYENGKINRFTTRTPKQKAKTTITKKKKF